MLKMATAPIKSLLLELPQLEADIKERQKKLKELKKRLKDIKSQIESFLKEKNQPGVRDQNIAVVSEEVKRVKRIKKSEVKEATMNVLLNYMDSEKAAKIYKQINNAEREEENVKKLKVIKLTH